MRVKNDLKDLISILDRAGCIYTLRADGDETKIVIGAGGGPANGGIEGMSTEVVFSKHGLLVCVSLWGPVRALSLVA